MIRQAGVDALHEGVQQEVEKAGLNNCQYALAIDGEVVVTETFGSASPDARFVMMSATKPIVASVVWQLIGESKLDPALPVVTWWPEFGANGKDVVTLEQVLLHTCGFPGASLSDAASHDRDLRVEEMQSWSLEWEPGSRFVYHGFSAHWVLAELIERLAGTDYRQAIRARVLDPLGLDRLELGVAPGRQGDVQAIHNVGDFPQPADIEALFGVSLTELLSNFDGLTAAQSSVDVFTTRAVLEAGVPGAGAVSDAASLALFYQHLLHDPKGLWDPGVLQDVRSNVRVLLPDHFGRAAFRTLGLETAGDDDKAHLRLGAGATSPRAFGHGGAGGQISWADPATGLSFAFLTSSFDNDFVRNIHRDQNVNRLAAGCIEGGRS
jgi:CubicO group peptidase (beta-lactamase class C family)